MVVMVDIQQMLGNTGKALVLPQVDNMEQKIHANHTFYLRAIIIVLALMENVLKMPKHQNVTKIATKEIMLYIHLILSKAQVLIQLQVKQISCKKFTIMEQLKLH
jgi:hypothetical protein